MNEIPVATDDSDPRIAQAQSEIAEGLTRLCNDTGLTLFSVRASGRYKHTADMPKCQAVSFNVKVMLEVPPALPSSICQLRADCGKPAGHSGPCNCGMGESARV